VIRIPTSSRGSTAHSSDERERGGSQQRSLEVYFVERTVNWSGIAYPNEGWAWRVFGRPDVERLWDLVAHAVRLDEPDPVAAWKDHMARLVARAGALNERRFDAVRFLGPGTELTVGLLPASQWVAAEFETVDGRRYIPNIPTEEVATTPDPARTEGTVRATRPFSPTGGVIVEGLRMRPATSRTAPDYRWASLKATAATSRASTRIS
jgi:aminopeptidase